MKRVAILDDYQDVALQCAPWSQLANSIDVVTFRTPFADADDLTSALADFDVLVLNRERTAFPASVLERLPKLGLIVTSGMRNASVDIGFANERGVVVSGSETLGYPTAELTWGLILAAVRHLPQETAAMQQGGWQATVGTGLYGKTLGIMGLGRIGSNVARIGAAFGMNVAAWSPHLTHERASEAGATAVTRANLLADSDILTLHMPLNTSSRHSIDAGALAAMKRTALIVNTSRGGLIDEAALIDALSRNALAGAALDVYDIEPLPAGHPLRRFHNVTLTPHLGYVTEENYRLSFGQAVENIAAWLSGNPIRTIAAAPK